MDQPTFIIGRDEELDEYLAKHKPSQMVADDDYEYIYVTDGRKRKNALMTSEQRQKALVTSQEVLQQLTSKLETMKPSPSVSRGRGSASSNWRAQESSGWRSGRGLDGQSTPGERSAWRSHGSSQRPRRPPPTEHRKIQQTALKEGKALLQAIAEENNFTTGKWIYSGNMEKCDEMFATLARSLESGPLLHTPALEVNASIKRLAEPNSKKKEHGIVCLFFPNVYDRAQVEEVLRVVREEHGFTARGAKPELYTAIGLYKGDPSKLSPTVWNAKDFLPDLGLKKEKEETVESCEDVGVSDQAGITTRYR